MILLTEIVNRGQRAEDGGQFKDLTLHFPLLIFPLFKKFHVEIVEREWAGEVKGQRTEDS